MESSAFSADLFHEQDLEHVYKPKPNQYNVPTAEPALKPIVTVVMQEPKDSYFWN